MRLSIVLSLVNLLAILFLPACNSVRPAIPETIVPAIDSTTTSQPEPTEPFDATGAWQTYQSQAGGYIAKYPADWTVDEQAAADGSSVTTFSPADGSAGIIVIVQSGEFAGAGNSDIPNSRCEQVIIGGLTGMRCFDTINFATSTIVVANGQTFTIATLGKLIDESIYSRFLSGFRIIS